MSDMNEELRKIRANTEKLRNCPRHTVEPGTYKFGQKMECIHCHGRMSGPDFANYLRGYKAAGGNPDDVWPGFENR